MANTAPPQESVDFREAEGFECKLDFIRSLASPVKSPQRRRIISDGHQFSPPQIQRLEDTSFQCPKSSSPNSDKMCDGVATLSTASSDGNESTRRDSSISGCTGFNLEVEERREHRSSSASWSGSACSDIEEDRAPDSPQLNPSSLQECSPKPTFQQRRRRCARVVSALAEKTDYKLYGYKSLRAAFEAVDRDGDGRLSIDELKTLLGAAGLSEKAVVCFFESMRGIYGGDSIDYKQFLAAHAPATTQKGCHGRRFPRNFRTLRSVPSVEGDRKCMY